MVKPSSFLTFLFLFFIAFTSLNADPFTSSRETDPASIVHNVSTIFGDYSDIEMDLVVSGPDKLTLSRYYSSQKAIFEPSLGGWFLRPQNLFMIDAQSGDSYKDYNGVYKLVHLYIGMQEGSILKFSGWQNLDKPEITTFTVDVEDEVLGVANTARGKLSSWTNVKNYKVVFQPENNSYELFFSDGRKNTYSYCDKTQSYQLSVEALASGNKITSEYDEQGRLIKLSMLTEDESQTMSWITLSYGTTVKALSSDEYQVEYHFIKSSAEQPLLNKVTNSQRFDIEYEYQIIDQHPLLIKKLLPLGRYLALSYNQDGKVKSISSPAGESQLSSTTFEYTVDKDGSGCTEVINPLGQKTCYYFDGDFQLTSIEQYLNDCLYRKEKKVWGEKSSKGNLVASYVEDSEGKCWHYKSYEYDPKGNLILEKEYGNFTGSSPDPVMIQGQENPSGECHIKKYTYSVKDGLDVILEGDSLGLGVELHYKKGTNILAFKGILEEGSLRKRHFYDYTNGALSSLIVDDGKVYDKNKTDNVKERLITRISSRVTMPNFNAPEVVEEKFYDVKSKKEILLKKTAHQFDSKGLVTSGELYDANNRLVGTFYFQYDSKGRVIQETDLRGLASYYQYDELNHLIEERDHRKQTRYVYDIQGNLITQSEIDCNGKTFETNFKYDLVGNKIEEVDKGGRTKFYIYDQLGRLQVAHYPEIFTNELEKGCPKYTYSYDLFDHLITCELDGSRTSYAYNIHGQPAKIEYPDGKKESFNYSISGALTEHIAADGNKKKYQYNTLGHVKEVNYYFGDATSSWRRDTFYHNSFHLTSKSEGDAEYSFEYDGAGRLIQSTIKAKRSQSTSPSKNKTTFSYNSFGHLESMKKWKSETEYSAYIKKYDLLGQLTEELIENEKGKLLSKTAYRYNEFGELWQVIGYPNNQESILMSYEYDGFGRLVKAIEATGSTTYIDYNDSFIDNLGQKSLLKTTTYADGTKFEEVYNPRSELTQVTTRDSKGNILAAESYFYDLKGNRVLEKAQNFSIYESKENYSNAYSFLQSGDMKSSMIESEQALDVVIENQYNNYGQLIHKHVLGFENPNYYCYNHKGALSFVEFFHQKDNRKIKYEFYTDETGQVVQSKVVGSKQKVDFTYNAVGCLLTEKNEDDHGAYTVNVEYDGEGNIIRVILPDSSHIQYSYEGPFIEKISRFSNSSEELYFHKVLERDLMGNVIEESLIGRTGLKTSSYDFMGRQIEIKTDFYHDEILSFDITGNITDRLTELKDQEIAQHYEYDSLGQLTCESGLTPNTYEYDLLQNCISQNGELKKINHLNQLIAANGITYSYSQVGNLYSKESQSGSTSYFFDSLGRLVEINTEDGSNIQFTYDHSNRRLTKKVKDKKGKVSIFRYFYLGDYELGSLDEKGKVIELRIPSNPNNPNQNNAVAIELDNQPYASISDLNGNISCLVHPLKRKVVESYAYSAFGQGAIFNERGKEISDTAIHNPWRYQGKYHDSESGFVYFGQRYYDSHMARWISPDPAGTIDGLNLYAYTRNNPLKFKDFSGLVSEACGCGYCNRHDGCHCLGTAPAFDSATCDCNNSCCAHRQNRNVQRSFCGVAHGSVDVLLRSAQDFQSMAFYSGANSLENILDYNERLEIIQNYENSQRERFHQAESIIQDFLGVDSNDAKYASYRAKTRLGLELASLAVGGYGVLKGTTGFNKLIKISNRSLNYVKTFGETKAFINRSTSFAGSRRLPLDYAPYQKFRNKSAFISGRKYSGHALDRMQDRGLMPSIIENTLNTSNPILTDISGTLKYYDSVNKVKVIVSEKGQIITIIPGRG